MEKEKDWNPNQYLKFEKERTQPSIDLVNRINISNIPKNIIDIGCGPGNSSQVLMSRWPHADLVGVDNSPAMIEKAKNDFPEQKWILSDIREFKSDLKFELVFSNAAIQWIPNHSELMNQLMDLTSERGAIAIQTPKFNDMPVKKIIYSVSQNSRWKKATEGCLELFTYHDYRYYYDLLANKMRSIDMWETEYIHVMPSHHSIIEWIKSTGMKPYLDQLNHEKDKIDFEQDVLKEIKKSYPVQKKGEVLFPFKRLFFIGYR